VKRTAVIVDPHPLWLEAVEGVLERLDFEVVGKATAHSDALRRVQETNPDLLVAEIQSETSEDAAAGLRLIEGSRKACPRVRVVVLSNGADDVDDAIGAGAHAYVVKSVHPDDLTSTIRQVFENSVFLAYNGSGQTGLEVSRIGDRVRESIDHGLTRRELEIVTLVSEGHSNAELGRMLWVTEQTVKFHLSNIYRKLGVSNRTEASRWAQLHGLLEARPVELDVA